MSFAVLRTFVIRDYLFRVRSFPYNFLQDSVLFTKFFYAAVILCIKKTDWIKTS